MGSHHPIRKTAAPEPTVIPDKLYFRIGDVARLCQVPTYVLRFWETEFPSLKPNKGGTGQRLYRKRDVEMALRIKSLLYDQGYTIPGARQVFKAEARTRESAESQALPQPPASSQPLEDPAAVDMGEEIRRRAQQQPHLQALRDDLLTLLAVLSAPSGRHPASATAEATVSATVPRPRLMLEPRPPSQRPIAQPPRRDPLQLQQRDLFAIDSPESSE